jgi:hypothetical protein
MMEPSRKSLELDSCTIVVDWLIYRSYEWNRSRAPHIEPERWRKLYINAETYEKIYQKNLERKS